MTQMSIFFVTSGVKVSLSLTLHRFDQSAKLSVNIRPQQSSEQFSDPTTVSKTIHAEHKHLLRELLASGSRFKFWGDRELPRSLNCVDLETGHRIVQDRRQIHLGRNNCSTSLKQAFSL